MQTLIIPRMAQAITSAANIPAAFAHANVAYTPVTCVNWPESFPYKPVMEFAAAHTGDALLLHYRVEEQSVRAVAQQDQDNIWEDSCAEFFCMPAADGIYYNVECNCTGKLLLAAGKDRHQRQPAPQHILQLIDRWASLGTDPFDTRQTPTRWELALRLPSSIFFLHDIPSFNGLDAKGNVYKCGDCLPVPHFISWSPIATESPDFHRPEFFAQIRFA